MDQSAKLQAFVADRKLLWWNITMILILNLGWAACFAVVTPLIQLTLSRAGVSVTAIGMLGTINSWAYSYLVMYFAWKSDHTVSRFGRRIPYLFLSAPFIIIPIVLFPLFQQKWILFGLALLQMLAMDIKAATIPLLNYDCVPRHLWARINALSAIVLASVSFLSVRYGMRVADAWEPAPYLCAGIILAATTLVGGFLIREPPIQDPTSESFKPWSAMKVAWKDPRAIILMLGIAMGCTFSVMYGQWIWLFAKKELGLSRGDIGIALSWSILLPLIISAPIGWVIDRFGSHRVLVAYLVLVCVAAWWVIHRTCDATSLAILALLAASIGPFYEAAYILLFRQADPKHLGSVSSTNSFLRGALVGLLSLLSGVLIDRNGEDYRVVFKYGAALSVAGVLLIMGYGYLTGRTSPAPSASPASAAPGDEPASAAMCAGTAQDTRDESLV